MGNLKRALLIGAGFLSLILAIIGTLLPVMPAMPFFIIASLCFSASSKKFHNMLLNNKWIGSHIRNFHERKGLSLRTKATIIIFQWLASALTAIFIVKITIVRIILVIMALGVTAYILSLKTSKE